MTANLESVELSIGLRETKNPNLKRGKIIAEYGVYLEQLQDGEAWHYTLDPGCRVPTERARWLAAARNVGIGIRFVQRTEPNGQVNLYAVRKYSDERRAESPIAQPQVKSKIAAKQVGQEPLSTSVTTEASGKKGDLSFDDPNDPRKKPFVQVIYRCFDDSILTSPENISRVRRVIETLISQKYIIPPNQSLSGEVLSELSSLVEDLPERLKYLAFQERLLRATANGDFKGKPGRPRKYPKSQN
jgi:hypothetical protein